MKPKARRADLLTQEVGNDLVIYDQRRDHVYSLNSTAAMVWRLCDGTRSEAEIAHGMTDATGSPVNEAVVQLALEELRRRQLLVAHRGAVSEPTSPERRQLLKRAAQAAGLGLVLPIITTAVMPSPARAQGGDPGGGAPKDECTGTYELQRPVTAGARGENCEDARKKASQGAFVFINMKCAARKCKTQPQSQCVGEAFKATGECKEEKTWIWTITAYKCKCAAG